MKIGMIADHCCIRVQKISLPLIDRGHDVYCVASKLPSFSEQYKAFSLFQDIGQLSASIKLLENEVDIFHVHNEPSWFVTLVKEITDKPVVLDVHDSFLARSTPQEDDENIKKGVFNIRISTEERNNFQLADALVYPGNAFRKIVESEFGLTQPSITLPSYVPQQLYRYNAGPYVGGLVYEGKVVLPEKTGHGFGYCDYLDLAKECDRVGMDFHIYAGKTDKKFVDTYKYDRVYVHRGLDYQELLKSVSNHDWGLVGNIKKTAEWSVAMPNKMFEYLACQVPVVAINAGACAEFILEHDIGIVVDDIEDLAWRWKEHRKCRANVIKKRRMWAMDNHITKLEELYLGIING